MRVYRTCERLIVPFQNGRQNICRRKFRLYRAGIALYPGSRRFKQAIVCFLITKKKYLESAIETVNARYGSVVAYCKAELGVTDEDVARMRKKYLLRDSDR